MEIRRQRIVPVYIEEEMKKSYLGYSMSVIFSRAFPDIRDGLKPSQRRILVAMNDLSLAPNRAHRKCAKIAGDTSGNYHPHGEGVVYPTLVRMAQDFNMRYRLVDGQGNFGSIDGDPPAAMRYTEARLTPLAVEMLEDLDKDTVDFQPNYDETRKEPAVLPSRFPNLICNGCSGIGVGMATNIPPHNLAEVVDGLTALIDNPDLTDDEIMNYVKGPDFPTGGIICGMDGIREAYRTGKGSIIVRARANVETLSNNNRENIVITEIPYSINKTSLLEKIASLIQAKKIDGIADLRDESDRDGLRIVIELKRNAYPRVVLNQLYKHTQLQTTFGVIMLALVDGRPAILPLKEMMRPFIDHRHQVLLRKTNFDLSKAKKRAHILEGFKIALDHIDEIIDLLKRSRDPVSAKMQLIERFRLSEEQAQAILSMQLQRLTGLERRRIEQEYFDVLHQISDLESILANRARRMEILKAELLEIREKYGDERRTNIIGSPEEINVEDMIAEEDMVVTISHSGYIKRLPVSSYRRQRRGGKGITGMTTREEDFVEHLYVASTHSRILFLTEGGRCYSKKVHEVPQAGRASKGRHIVNLLEMAKDEKVAAIVPVESFDSHFHLIMATEKGKVKKTLLSNYEGIRRTGINAIGVEGKDRLIGAALTDGSQDIILVTREGQAIRFSESDVRPMGRTAAGVRGITLASKDRVIGMVVVKREGTLLVVCENGHGKRSAISDYRITHRAGKGVISIRTTERNGYVVAVKEVVDDDELMIMSQKGLLIRLSIRDIKTIGRNTQGVRLIKLSSGDKVIDVARVMIKEEKEVEEAAEELEEDTVV